MSGPRPGRLYGMLLRALPAAFRSRYGSEMRRMFEDELSEASPAGRIRLWLRAIGGIAWTAIVERVRPGYGARRGTADVGLTGLGSDVRAAFRGLARKPGFALTAVLTLALGIGATSAVFTVVDATILRALSLPDADRLVSLWTTFERQPGADFLVSQAEYADLRSDVRSFEGVAGWSLGETMLEPRGDAPARTVGVAFVTGDLYRITGARAALGRLPGEEDDVAGAPSVVLLTWGLWQTQFGADPVVIGTDASILGFPTARIIGVLAAGAALPNDVCGGSACAPAPAVWVHWVQDPAAWATDRSGHGLNVVARLRDGIGEEAARSELARLQGVWAERYAGQHGFGIDGHDVRVTMLADRVLGTARRVGFVLSIAAGLLLVLACANVANLMLARGETRTSEVGVRIALGASRFRVATPVLLEGLMLALAAGLAGLLFAFAGLPLLLRLAPAALRAVPDITVDLRAILFASTIAGVSGILFAVGPAWSAARRPATSLMRASGRGRTGGTRGLRLLVAGQTALATLLLTGAGLLTRSLRELNAVDPGLEANGRVTLDLVLSPSHHPDGSAVMAGYDDVIERVQSMGGVAGAAVVRSLPLRDAYRRENVLPEGVANPDDRVGVAVQIMSAGALGVLGVPLLEGRDFARTDVLGQPPVALINAVAARALWPGESAVGKRVRATFAPGEVGFITIVGVYRDVRSGGLSSAADPEFVLPLAQVAHVPGWSGWARRSTLVVRTALAPVVVTPALRSAIAAADPMVAVQNASTMSDVVRASAARERFLGALLGVFALLALAIAAVGVHGVVSFTVARQGPEFAIRNALGAARSAILFGVLRATAVVAGAGAAAGAAIALFAAPGLRAFLYNVQPRDSLVLVGVPAVLTAVALISSLAPACRATRVQPADVLQGNG